VDVRLIYPGYAGKPTYPSKAAERSKSWT